MNELDAWVSAVCEELGLQPDAVPDAVLDVARDVAHEVARPAAPLTTFLLGRAVEAGVPLAVAAQHVSQLAANWNYNDSTPAAPAPPPAK